MTDNFIVSLPVATPIALRDWPAETLAGILAGDAIEAIIAQRIKQLEIGHTPERDADDVAWRAIDLAREYALIALDRVRCAPEQRNLPSAQKKLAQAAALCMAAYDRLALEIEAERSWPDAPLPEQHGPDGWPPAGADDDDAPAQSDLIFDEEENDSD